jgi:hypothetical protein
MSKLICPSNLESSLVNVRLVAVSRLQPSLLSHYYFFGRRFSLTATCESATATIDARDLRNALASFDTRALRSAINFTIKDKGKIGKSKYRLEKTIF